MNVKYFGRKTKDCLGEPLKRSRPPCAVVSFTNEEEVLAVARLEYTNYRFDLFGDATDGCAYVEIEDRDDYNDFMEIWKEAKEKVGKVDLK